MSLLLWIDTDKDEAIDLGDPLDALPAFGRMAALDSGQAYPELFAVTSEAMAQDDVAPEWLERVRTQAAAFLKAFSPKLDDVQRDLLETLAQPAQQFAESPTMPTAAINPIKVEIPSIRQETPYSCGAASLRAVCQYFGRGWATEAGYREMLGTTEQDGTPPEALIDGAKQLGLQVLQAGDGMTAADLRGHLDAGHPVICDIQAWADDPARTDWHSDMADGHYVVAIGYDDTRVFFEDPAVATSRDFIAWEQFEQRWHDTEAPKGPDHDHWGLALAGPDEVGDAEPME